MPLQFVAQGPMALPAASSALGIGDVVPGATFYAGLRVYNTSKVGANAILIQRSFDNTNATLKFKANGFIDCTNVAGSGQILSVWRDAPGVGTLRCVKMYEQISGIASDGSATVPMAIVDETRGVLIMGSDTNTESFGWTGLTGIQTSGGKFSMVGTAKHKSGANNSVIVGSVGGPTNWQLGSYLTPANTAMAFQNTGTTSVDAPCSDDAWHAQVASMDNINSFQYVDASKTSTSTGSTDNIGDNSPFFMSIGGFNPYRGRCFEGALYGSALSDGNASAIASNIAAMITSAGLT